MRLQVSPYLILLLLSAVALLGLARIAWRRRSGSGETPFVLLMFAGFFWLFTYAMEFLSIDLPTKLLWVRFEYLSIVTVPVLWLIFVLAYLRRREWLTTGRVALLFVVPAITLIMVWTNDLHHLHWATVSLRPSGPLLLFKPTYGPWFWVHAVYSYGLSLAAAAALLREYLGASGLYRGQLGFLLLGWVMILLANALTISPYNPLPGLDLVPFVFGPAALLFGWSVFRYRLFDLVPAAYDQVIRSMDDGVVVLDVQGRIVDFNPAAQAVLAGAVTLSIGEPAERVFAAMPELALSAQHGQTGLLALSVGQGEEAHYLDVRRSPLRGQCGELTGHVLVLRDVSERRRVEQALQQSEERFRRLADKIEHGITIIERDQVVYVNDRACAISGYPREEYVALTWLDLAAPEEKERLALLQEELIRTGTDLDELEFWIVRKDGARRYIRNRYTFTRLEGGGIGCFVVTTDLTGRKQAEEALRQSESRYRSLFEDSAVSLWEEDWSQVREYLDRLRAEGVADFRAYFEAHPEAVADCVRLIRVLDVNKATMALHGVRSKAVLLDNPDLAFTAETYQTFGKEIAALAEGHTHFEDESVHRTASGETRHVVVQVNVPPGYEDSLSKVLVSMLDISERKQAEQAEREQRALAEALRDAAAALNSTLELDKVLECILDVVGHVVPHDAANVMLVEGGVARIAGQRGYVERGLDKALTTIRFPVARTPTLRHMAETGQPLVIHDTQAYPDWVKTGERNWIRSYAGVPISLEGEVLGFLNLDSATPGFFAESQGDHLRAFANQAALAIQNARLYGESLERNRKLALLNRITHIGTATLALDDLLQTLVDSAVGIIGADDCYLTLWDAEKGRPIPAAAYGPMRDSYRDEVVLPGEQTLTESALRLGRPLVVEDVYNTPHLSRRIAERFPACSVLTIPLVVDQRDLGALLLSFNQPHHFTDDEINWSVQAAELFALAIAKAQAYAELQERNRELDAFSYTVAHDLQSPLHLIIGYTDLLDMLSPEELVADGPLYWQKIQEAAHMMSEMIGGLLLFAQLRNAEGVVTRVEMGPVVEAALARFRDTIERRKVDVQVMADLPPALGYGLWLEEVFANLVNNALKYSGQHNTRQQIRIRGFRQGNMVRYEVQDNGVGIPPEAQRRLFRAFSRVHPGEAQGFGLGLSIVARIVARLNGEVGVESTPGQGSTFWFTLPAAE